MKDRAPDSAQELKARALRLLARREHSRAELARKLAPHAESLEALQILMEFLVSRNQLSDDRYAEERARKLARKYGTARIRNELKSKGISEETIVRASAEAASSELERARYILERKYRTPAATHAEHAKRARFLHGRGFSHETIRRALREYVDES